MYLDVCKQMTDVKLWLLYSNTWDYLKMSVVSFLDVINKLCLQIIYYVFINRIYH